MYAREETSRLFSAMLAIAFGSANQTELALAPVKWIDGLRAHACSESLACVSVRRRASVDFDAFRFIAHFYPLISRSVGYLVPLIAHPCVRGGIDNGYPFHGTARVLSPENSRLHRAVRSRSSSFVNPELHFQCRRINLVGAISSRLEGC